MADIEALLEQIGGLSLTEAADLVKKMEEKFDISTAAPVAVAAAGGDAGGADAADQNFNVVLKTFGAKKIDVIKAVRAATGLGLKEAKDMVEKGDQVIKEDLPKDAANELKGQLEAAGATAELTPA